MRIASGGKKRRKQVVEWQRMEAVKRAYAEIILNTAAESAARILASERKAMGLQRSLATTKQDAVDMMLRLKSLMDSKINEAETRNLLHARRIQELESQLEKAKSVILSLQSDLEREREVNKNNNNKTQQAGPIVIEEEENTSSYYQNVVSTDNSSCSIKDTLRTGTGTSIGTNQGSKVRSRNRLTQRVRAFDQSKDPKGGQNLGKNRKNKKSRENDSSDRKVFLMSDPPRRSRTKSNYVKISKFGMKIDGNVSQNGNKVLKKCTEKEKEAMHNLDSGVGFITDEAPVGLELIADNIDKEDDKPAIEELIAVDPKSTETKADLEELETPVPDTTAEQGLRSIKYTFRRKRKRGLSENTDEVIPPPAVVVPVLENNKDENRNNEENKEVSDSPRSNRRMVQVARQMLNAIVAYL
ncbi:hypothetical protein FCM35_KLT17078 [Carex littledalei]|uniref:Uncharacterized protein n=1 Tax=Carex littledalei TaxID=544730 RepID=A0A833RLW6_9POAL|nr:hypothetical protein FCM35_KLT17078 [Carex littledalei]